MLYFQNSSSARSPFDLHADLIKYTENKKNEFFNEEKNKRSLKRKKVPCNPNADISLCSNSQPQDNLTTDNQSILDNQGISLSERKVEKSTSDASPCHKKQKFESDTADPIQTISLKEINGDVSEYRKKFNEIDDQNLSGLITQLDAILKQPPILNKSIGQVFLERLNERIIEVLSTKPHEDIFNIDDFFEFLKPVPTVMCLWNVAFLYPTLEKITQLRKRMPVLLFYYWLRDYIYGTGRRMQVLEFSKLVTQYIDPDIWRYMTSESILYGLNHIQAEKFQTAIWCLKLGKNINDIIFHLLLNVNVPSYNCIAKIKYSLFNLGGLQGFLDIANECLNDTNRKFFDDINHVTRDIKSIEAAHFDNTDIQQKMHYTNGDILELAKNKK